MVEDEQFFIAGEWRAAREDHGVIIRVPSIEAVSENFRVKGGECTVNVGDVVEMESQGHLIPKVTGEVEIDGELNGDQEKLWLHGPLGRCAYLRSLASGDFTPHHLLPTRYAKVTQLPFSPREDPPSPEGSPSVDTRPPLERETNTLTQGELDHLRESCSFPAGIQIRLPELDKTVMSTRPGEFAISLNEFKNLFGLFNNPKPDFGWLYFKARPKKTLLWGYPNNVNGWKKKFFFVSGNNWEFLQGLSQDAKVPRVSRSWGTPGKCCNMPPILTEIE
ncbi:hypothetical protein Acr_16g0001260 [Actinidia rufa]|uniref:Uncharacterized protein n=1 Tax=Actinidia rufa TaxID=165716 RepID=A0A7J0FXS9_9ERIC|nr:hypothetical protein Acr_16g0001260 [Actinidia rufa]